MRNPYSQLTEHVKAGRVHWSVAVLSGFAIPVLIVWASFEVLRLIFG
jgi:hypothetical protein